MRGRVLAGAVKGANLQLAKDGHVALPEGLTLHAPRRTFASVLVALNKDPRYVMRQMGHTSANGTMTIYAHVMEASDEDRQRLRALIEGDSELGNANEQAALTVSARTPKLPSGSPRRSDTALRRPDREGRVAGAL